MIQDVVDQSEESYTDIESGLGHCVGDPVDRSGSEDPCGQPEQEGGGQDRGCCEGEPDHPPFIHVPGFILG